MTDSEYENMPPFSLVVDQRVRNRQMEWLEMAIEVESDPPPFDLDEVIEIWFDWNRDPATLGDYLAPTYLGEEAALLVAVGDAVERFCQAKPPKIADEEALKLPEWAEVVASSMRALDEMSKRGRLPEYSGFEKTPAFQKIVDRRKRNLEMEMLKAVIDFESMSATWNLERLHHWWFQSHKEKPELAHYPAPAYTDEEARLLLPAVEAIHRFWEAWCAMPANTAEVEGRALPEWAALEVAAKEALIEMAKRGRISEDGP